MRTFYIQNLSNQQLPVNIKQISKVFLIVFATILLYSIPAKAEVTNLEPTKDTHINKNRPKTGFGASPLLKTKDKVKGKSGLSEILLQFDLSTIPQDATITVAYLKLYNNYNRNFRRDNASRVYAVLDAWNEFVSWDNKPPTASSYEDNIIIESKGEYYQWNMTDLAQDWVDGTQTNYGVTVRSEGSGRLFFSSRESSVNKPILYVEYSLPPSPEPTPSPVPISKPNSTLKPTPTPNQPPKLSLTANPTTGNSPLLVNFETNASDLDGEILEWRWDYNGDGKIDEKTTSSSASFVYTSSGSYKATVEVVDNKGMSASDSLVMSVTSPAPSPTPSPAPTPTPKPTACDGVTVYPDDDLYAVTKSRNAGTTFCIKAGTHTLSDSILAESNDSYIGEPGAVIDGGGTVIQAFFGFCVQNQNNYQNDVTIRGLVIKNFKGNPSDPNKNAAVKPGCNWTIEDNEISYNAEEGVKVDRGTILRRNNIHHNGRYGITATPSKNANILIEDNEIAYNNDRKLDPNYDAGGSKLVGVTNIGLSGVKWIGNWVHHNYGNGIWHDLGVGPDIEIAYNTVEYNEGSGIFVELSFGHDVHDNIVRFNQSSSAGRDCFWGGQIDNNNSPDVHIYSNTIESVDGSNGICLIDTVRNDVDPAYPQTITNSSVHDNTIKIRGNGMTGLVGDEGPYNLSNVKFYNNIYYVPSFSGRHWAFEAYPLSKQEWQSIGQDSDGEFFTW